ncbi:hypothetical protein EDC01DRAFT_717538 [Geopyxis carbonaria]|nr:hypothetical protein EDC01DRAFT_717538 [Geopyxis carbonaria]
MSASLQHHDAPYESSRPSSRGRRSSSPPSLRHTTYLHREHRKVLHPLADESEDGYSSHPSIYSASPVGSAPSDKENSPQVLNSSKQKAAEVFGEDVLDGSNERDSLIIERSHYPGFSGLNLLQTINERKSGSTVRVDNEYEDSRSARDYALDSSDDEYDLYGRAFYYEYASPTQPLHPVRAHTAPPPELSAEMTTQYHNSSVPMVNSFFSPTAPQTPYAQRPTFRLPTSMNRSYGSIGAHPFHRAPVADRRNYVDPNIPTPDELESNPPRSRRASINGSGTWNSIVRGCCLVCCCLVVSESEVEQQ